MALKKVNIETGRRTNCVEVCVGEVSISIFFLNELFLLLVVMAKSKFSLYCNINQFVDRRLKVKNF